MKTCTKLSLLAVLFTSSLIWGSIYAAGHSAGDSVNPSANPSTRHSASSIHSTTKQEVAPATTSQEVTPAQLMRMKMQYVCAHADKNLDGYLSRIEFMALEKTETAFKATDNDLDGRLSLHECVRALGIS